MICVGLSGPALRYYLRHSELDAVAFPNEMTRHPAWIDPAAFSPSTLDAEAAALDEWLRYKDFTELPKGVRDEAPEDPQLAKAVEVLREALQGKGAGKSR